MKKFTRCEVTSRTGDLQRNTIIRHAVSWLLGIFLVIHLPLGQAEQSTPIPIDIPSQPLGAALQRLKQVTGMPLIVKPEQTLGKHSSSVKGNLSPRQALDALLVGTELHLREENGTLILFAQSAEITPAGKEQPITLPEVMIKQIKESSYGKEEASSATRIPTPIQDIPRSISVVTRNVIEDQKAFRIDEAVRNVSGTFMSSTFGGRAGEFMIRGFRSEQVFKNGFREDSTYGARAGRDTANIESIEVVKGPPSYLYGRSDPGGIINQITKAPLRNPYFSGEMIFGSYGLYRPTIDIGGPLNASGILLPG